MASDITLAVGDGSRRMTYAELADMRRISVASAERLVRRRRWERISGNDGVVRISVPLDEARKPPSRSKRVSVSGQRTSPPDNEVVRTLESAVSALSAQLENANQRAERAEERADRTEKDVRDLRRQLDVSQAAERRAHDEAERRRAELEAAWEWGLLRRLRWALGRRR